MMDHVKSVAALNARIGNADYPRLVSDCRRAGLKVRQHKAGFSLTEIRADLAFHVAQFGDPDALPPAQRKQALQAILLAGRLAIDAERQWAETLRAGGCTLRADAALAGALGRAAAARLDAGADPAAAAGVLSGELAEIVNRIN